MKWGGCWRRDGSTKQGCGGNEKINRETKRGKEREEMKAVIRGPEVSEQGMLVPNEIGSLWPCRTTFGSYSARLSPFHILDEAHSTLYSISPYHRNRPRRCWSSITSDARSRRPAILRNLAIYIYSARDFYVCYAPRRIVTVTRDDHKNSRAFKWA